MTSRERYFRVGTRIHGIYDHTRTHHMSYTSMLKTTDAPIRSKNYGIESGCRADKHQVSHVKCLVYMYKCFNKKHSIVDRNAKTQTRFALMTMHDVSKYKKSNPNCFQEKHRDTNNFIDQLYSLGLHPLIRRPTRITSHSNTLIDNIYIYIQKT